jgi:hypothetical protein
VSIVVTLSGAIGSRRSQLAGELGNRLHWPKVKFSDYIKELIVQDGGDPADRTLLQSYGQKLVQTRLKQFVDGVLARAPDWREQGNLIVDGLRHVEALIQLRQAVDPSRLLHVNITANPLERETGARERGIAEQNLYRYDRDLTEAQISRILPAYADMNVDAQLGMRINAEEIISLIEQREPGIVHD